MFKSIKNLLSLFDNKSKKKLLLSQIILIIAAIFEILGILCVAPLMQLISNVDILNDENQFITKIYYYFEISSYAVFVRIISLSVLIIFFINFLISIYSIYFITKFSQDIGNYLKSKLFKFYALQPWIIHSKRDTSTYVTRIIYDTNRISSAIILPLLLTNAKTIIGLAIIIFIFFYDPVISSICFLVFFTFYILIFKVLKKKALAWGVVSGESTNSMLKRIAETFGGIRETILHKKQKKFYDDFSRKAKEHSKVQVLIQFFQTAPKILLEFIAFLIIVLSILYTSSSEIDQNLQETLPILAVYIFAGYKLLPIFQQVYFGLLSLKANTAAIDSIYGELEVDNKNEFIKEESLPKQTLDLKNKIQLKNISYSYENPDNFAIKNISLNIPANSFVSIVGPSGAGKSTILDTILGLLTPTHGEILIDETPLSSILDHYQHNISYVGQNIFLQNETIKDNICFGLTKSEIDEKKFLNAIEAANLSELIDKLPDGVHTMVGERGVKISGGQQQRIAIARALYLDRKIIVLDEATSSLDGISENNILKRLNLFAKNYKKTIIMVTHNINLTRSSDMIYLIDRGSLVQYGDYNTLLNNEIFKKLLNE
jgi:ABC-type multidrug transport system fused ATPase/permease subunit